MIASYHGVHDVNDFNADQDHMMALYERAALPIEKGGMALNNVAFISLTAFACSLVASMRELAKVFPDWIEIDDHGALVSVSQRKAPDVAAQVVNFANQYRALAPQGLFKEGDDFSAIIKTIDSVDARRLANQRRSQSQSENRLVLNEPLPLECCYSGSKTSQGALYSHLIETHAQRML